MTTAPVPAPSVSSPSVSSPSLLSSPSSLPSATSLLLEGSRVVNFRDVALASTPSRRIRPGVLYRSATLSHATPADLAVLKSLRVRLVLDLRSDEECLFDGVAPEDLSADRHQLSLMQRPWQIAEAPTSASDTHGYLADRYCEMLADSGARIVKALELILQRPGAAVVHCMAGKDRTGLVVAVLLSALGVDDEAVVADYERSALAMGRLRSMFLERFPERAAEILAQPTLFDAAPASAMRTAMSFLRTEFGSITGYLRTSGLSTGSMKGLELLLLET